MQFSLTELIGYFASLGVLVSFFMKDIRRLRIINTIGCCLFVAYGIMLQYSFPVIVTNVTIIGVNIYYLVKAKNETSG